ncbi:MAG: 3'-5' exonuclease [Candidatus Omnitrophica bacterium]|nr:3'-5' exonuclease [Candidatus Omnitrophota bacterium]
MQDILDKEFVIFDVETTGLSPVGGDRIVEIAALKVRNLEPVERFHSLINPDRSISPGAFEVNRISESMLIDAPRSHEILPAFLEFLGDAIIVGHNINFDLGFLRNELNLAGLVPAESFNAVDTIRISKRVMPHLKRYPLWFVASSLGVERKQSHRAMADVEMTFEVFYKLVHLAKEQNILSQIL